MTPRAMLLFILTRRGADAAVEVAAHRIDVSASSLADAVEHLRERLGARDLAFRGVARALYDLVLGPARESLHGRTTLVIVPDASLWDVPFTALLSPEGRFVVQDHAATLESSLTVWRELMRRPRVRGALPFSILAIGDPARAGARPGTGHPRVRDGSLGSLPSAAREALRSPPKRHLDGTRGP